MHLALAQLTAHGRVGWIRRLTAGRHGALGEVAVAQIADHVGCVADDGGRLTHAVYGTRGSGVRSGELSRRATPMRRT